MENFEQVKTASALAENGPNGVDALLPLAHREKQAAETRGLIIFLFTTALVFATWPVFPNLFGNAVTFLLYAVFSFSAAYLIRGTRRKREVAALTLASLEELRRMAPEKLQRSLAQKVLADRIRFTAKNRVGLKRGARPYTPQEKPGWKSVDYRRLLDLKATARKNRGDRAAFLYQMMCFLGSGSIVMIGYRLLHRYFLRRLTIPVLTVLFVVFVAVTLCASFLLTRRYWHTVARVYAYALDCEKESFWSVWNEAVHLHSVAGRQDAAEQKEDNGSVSSGAGRRRHRGGRGKKKPGEGAAAQGAAESKPAQNTQK
ncbi:MAG: hypothetical protein II776_03005 [Clostridia bacterium]|nr:hypothetical protein [Clostridia bacterium]